MKNTKSEVGQHRHTAYLNLLANAARSNRADSDFFSAAQAARRQILDEGLEASDRADGQRQFTTEQGTRAACYTREDVIVITRLQQQLLLRLDRNHNATVCFGWLAIALLAYIAYRVA